MSTPRRETRFRRSRRCSSKNGFALTDIVQSRLAVADFEHWQDAARAHGEIFGAIRPAFSLVHALPFVEGTILVEIEAIAVRDGA